MKNLKKKLKKLGDKKSVFPNWPKLTEKRIKNKKNM